MKTTRLHDLMVIGQLVLLAGMIMSFLIETGNIPLNSGTIIISHIYGALLAIAFLLIMVATYDFIHHIGHLLTKKLDEDWNIHLLSLMGITGLFYVAELTPEIGIVWMAFCIFGTITMLITHNDVKSTHGMVWAITIIVLIVSMHKWSFLESHVSRGKWIIAAMVLTFLTSYISKAWKVKRERKKPNKTN
jgi:hypothetical protein